MLSSLSSNVILSKARAMYGRRLTPQNYSELLNCQTVSEVAGYLKNRTAYGKILSGINESDIHRGQLENRLRQKMFQEYDSLCRYELSVGEHFAEYLIALNEIEQIMHSLVLLMAGSPQEYIFNMPMFLNRHTSIDLPSLAKIKNYDDLLQALGRTPYRGLLDPFRPVAGMPIDFTGIETALYTHLYR
ncbi:MAG: V-type ATPase subunit, partial [Bacillota bacterium]|nr:V-type ATPase subunit [Bacillota bacterium]